LVVGAVGVVGGGGWPLGGALATHRMTTMLMMVGLCV
jgi:hypothetical protein